MSRGRSQKTGKRNYVDSTVALYGSACVSYCPDSLIAVESEFFQGKTIRIIVGTSPGGGLIPTRGRLHVTWGKYIAGNPNFIVENMPDAGHRIAANHLYKVARPDGLTIGNFA